MKIGYATTIGNFDGLHLGHAALIAKIKINAKKMNLKTKVITFNPYPFEFFELEKNRILSEVDKKSILADFKIDKVNTIDFSDDFRRTSAEEFFTKYLLEEDVKYLIVGKDFKFGKERSGDFDFLSDWGSNNQIEVDRIPTHNFEGRRVSSTWIRESIADGNFDLAAKLLDRRYTFSGKVVFGNKVGRTIGVPTANIWVPKSNLPIKGVYAVKALVKGETFNGIANMGVRPTVGGTSPVLEIHIFDFNEEIYGCRIEVEFYQKIRNEKKFDNLDKLKEQINLDIAETRKYFS